MAGFDAEQDGEDHDADAVVEQRLARDPNLEPLGRTGRLQHAEDRDRIGGRDQRAEQQRVDPADVVTEHREQEVRRHADDRGRDQRAAEREHADGELLCAEIGDVDVERTREQQQAEQAVQQRVAEVELGDELAHAIGDVDHAGRLEREEDDRAASAVAMRPTDDGSLNSRAFTYANPEVSDEDDRGELEACQVPSARSLWITSTPSTRLAMSSA